MLDSGSFFPRKPLMFDERESFFPMRPAKIPQTQKFVPAKCNSFAVCPEPRNFLAAKLSDLKVH